MDQRFYTDKEVAIILTKRNCKASERQVQEWRRRGLEIHGFELVPVGLKHRWVECFDVVESE